MIGTLQLTRQTPRFGPHFDALAKCGTLQPDGVTLRVSMESECFARIEQQTRKPARPPKPAQANAPRSRTTCHAAIRQQGPKLWGMLHQWALKAELDPSQMQAWLMRFAGAIPCGDCAMDFVAMCRTCHPPASSNDALFAWTVRLHNNVNAKLGKPTVTVEEAKSLWGKCSSGACQRK